MEKQNSECLEAEKESNFHKENRLKSLRKALEVSYAHDRDFREAAAFWAEFSL